MKRKINTICNFIKSRSYKILLYISMFAWMLPMIFNFSKVNIVAKIFVLFGFALGLLGFIWSLFFFDKKKDKSETTKLFLLNIELLFLYCIGILKLFNYDLWGKNSFLMGLNLIIVAFFEFYYFAKSFVSKKHENEHLFFVLIALIFTFWFVALGNEETDNHKYAEICLKIGVGMCYLVLTSVFVNSFLYKKAHKESQLSKIILYVLFGGAILISFPYYIQWCGLKDNNFNTFVSVYSAFIGGAITLVGVAWTIKDSNDKRREDLERIERERIESEKKKARPLFSTVPIEKMPEDDSLSCWADPKHYKIGGTKVVAKIVNSDNSNFYIRKILIENCWCDVIGATHVLKGREISIGYFRDLNNEKTTAILNIEDVLGHNYYYRLEYYPNIYEGFFYACSAEQISEEELPK